MDMDQPQRDEAGRPFLKVGWDMRHIRLLHTAVSYYLHRMYPKNVKDVNGEKEKMIAMKDTLSKIILEYNFQSQ